MNSLVRKGRLAMAACALSTLNSGALGFCYPGLMTPYWQEYFHVDTGATGFIMTFILLGVGCLTLASGYLHPRIGTRRSILCGTALLIICMILANLASGMPMIYLWAFLNGAGTGLIYGPALTTVQHWLPGRRGFAAGIVNLVFGLAGAVMSPIYNWLFNWLGYQGLNNVILALLVVCNGLSLLYGELPDRVSLTPEEQKAHAARMQQMKSVDSTRGSALSAQSLSVREALRTKSFWAVWLTWAFMGAAGVSMISLAGNYAISIHLSGVAVITSFNLTNGISRIVAGTVSDYIGRNTTGCIAFLLGAVGYLLLPFCQGMFAVTVLAGFVGFAFGSLFAVSAPLVSDLFGLKHYGAIFSLAFSAYGFISGIVGPALVGQLLRVTGESYLAAFLLLAAFCGISAVCIMQARRSERLAIGPQN